MENEISRSVKKDRQWHAWAGTIEDLKRIGAKIEDLYSLRSKYLLEEFDRETVALDATNSIVRTDQREQLAKDLVVRTTLIDGDETISGNVDSILNELDRRTVERVTFEGTLFIRGSYETLSLRFIRKGVSSGIQLTISSTDQGWGRQAFSAVSDEIEKGVPWWEWLLRPFGTSLRSILFGLMAGSIAGQITPHAFKNVPLLLSVGLLLAILMNIINLYPPIRNWILPPFEVSENGSSSGTRRLIGIGSIALSIVIGVFVNMIS